MWKVIKAFVDLQDDRHTYKAGDEYPRYGVTVSEERISSLASADNKMHRPLIEKIEEPEEVKIPEIKRSKRRRGHANGNMPVPEKLVQPET